MTFWPLRSGQDVIKSGSDPAILAEEKACGVAQNLDFGDFPGKNSFLTSWNDVTSFRTFQARASFLTWPGTNKLNLVQVQKVVLDLQHLRNLPYSVNSLNGNFEKWKIFGSCHEGKGFVYSHRIKESITAIEIISASTVQKTRFPFSIKDLLSKCEPTCSFLWIWSHLLNNSLMENFSFCAASFNQFTILLQW